VSGPDCELMEREIVTSTESLGFPESVHVKTMLVPVVEDPCAAEVVRFCAADAAVGVPLITPVDAASIKPAGSTPDFTVQVNGDDPPCTKAARLNEKA